MVRVLRNITVALATVALAVIAAPSCDDENGSSRDCDYVVRRCRTVCDYGYACDSYWGCCYDRCWYDCIGGGEKDPVDPPPPSSAPPAPAADASMPTPPSASGDFAVLCAPCSSNDECKGGGLCIQRGGDAGPSGFCGHPCNTGADCPADFSCTEIGTSKQCVPTSGTCN